MNYFHFINSFAFVFDCTSYLSWFTIHLSRSYCLPSFYTCHLTVSLLMSRFFHGIPTYMPRSSRAAKFTFHFVEHVPHSFICIFIKVMEWYLSCSLRVESVTVTTTMACTLFLSCLVLFIAHVPLSVLQMPRSLGVALQRIF